MSIACCVHIIHFRALTTQFAIKSHVDTYLQNAAWPMPAAKQCGYRPAGAAGAAAGHDICTAKHPLIMDYSSQASSERIDKVPH